VSGFFGNGDGRFSCPAFHAGESLAGNDSNEASSTGSSAAFGDRNPGLVSFLDTCFVRIFAIKRPQFNFCSSQWRVSTAHKPMDTFSIGSKLRVKSHAPIRPNLSEGSFCGLSGSNSPIPIIHYYKVYLIFLRGTREPSPVGRRWARAVLVAAQFYELMSARAK
jgi:hypothetical protein